MFVGPQYQTCFMSVFVVKHLRCLIRCSENLCVPVTEVDPLDCGENVNVPLCVSISVLHMSLVSFKWEYKFPLI